MTRASSSDGSTEQGGSPQQGLPSAALPLHRWRRLDWRFLVPTLQTAGVACAGDVDEELLAALPLLDPQVHRIREHGDWDRVAGACSVVVLVSPDRQDVHAAAVTVRPGGWIYAEVSRQIRRRSGPRTLPGWRRAFRRAGLEEVTAYWHAPDFATCSRIIAVDADAAVREALSRYQDVRFGRLLSLAGRLALRLGLFPLAVREGSVLGRRPAGPAGDQR